MSKTRPVETGPERVARLAAEEIRLVGTQEAYHLTRSKEAPARALCVDVIDPSRSESERAAIIAANPLAAIDIHPAATWREETPEGWLKHWICPTCLAQDHDLPERVEYHPPSGGGA